jgi:hypothetical protein
LVPSKRWSPIGGGSPSIFMSFGNSNPSRYIVTTSNCQKRWSLIQIESNKFCGAIQNVQGRPKSGNGVIDLVFLGPMWYVHVLGQLKCLFYMCECPPFDNLCRFPLPWTS